MQELKELQAGTKPHGHQIATDMNSSLHSKHNRWTWMGEWRETIRNSYHEAAAEEKLAS